MNLLIFVKFFLKLFIFRTEFKTIKSTKENKENHIILRRQTQYVYDILANLSIFNIKIQHKEYLEEYLIDFSSQNIFLRIGEVPEYLHRKNFKNRILIKKLSLFNTIKCTEILSYQDVYLVIYNKFIGFLVPQKLRQNIETIINTYTSFDLQVRITVNETIKEFSIFRIYSSGTMIITITTDTIIIDDGVYLEKFPYYSIRNNSKYFLALFSYVHSILCLTSFTTKVYTDHTEHIFCTTVLPPMFMLTKKFRDEMIFKFSSSNGISSRFLNIRHCIDNRVSRVIEYIIQEPLDTSSLQSNPINGHESVVLNPQIYAIDPKDLKNILILNYDREWDITFTTKKSWKINSSLGTNMKIKIKFEFYTGISDLVYIILTFDGYTIIDDQWVKRTIKVKNIRGLISSGLQKIREIIKQGGNIICRIIRENNIEETYILNFAYDSKQLLIMEGGTMIPRILYPYISYINERDMDLCRGKESPSLSTIPEDSLPTRSQLNYVNKRNSGREMIESKSFLASFDEEDKILCLDQENTESDKQPEHIYIKTVSDSSHKVRRTRRISSTESVLESTLKNNETKLETSYFIERPECQSFYEMEENIDTCGRRSIDNCNKIDEQLRYTYRKIDKYLVGFVCIVSIIILIIGICFLL